MRSKRDKVIDKNIEEETLSIEPQSKRDKAIGRARETQNKRHTNSKRDIEQKGQNVS
jgi:hypothetical protein